MPPSLPVAGQRYRRPSSSNLPASCFDMFRRVRRIYLDPNERGNNIDEIMKSERISYRTYQQKRSLQNFRYLILENSTKSYTLQGCLMGENRMRLNQDFLCQNCQQILDRPEFSTNIIKHTACNYCTETQE